MQEETIATGRQEETEIYLMTVEVVVVDGVVTEAIARADLEHNKDETARRALPLPQRRRSLRRT